MKELDYELTKEKIIRRISAQKSMVLATCAKERVTARTVFCVSDGLQVYFITSKAYMKYKQLCENPNVALCFDNVQLEGRAALMGHPGEAENPALLRRCENLNDDFLYFVKYKNSVLFKVDISRAEMWINHGREYFDTEKKSSYRVG